MTEVLAFFAIALLLAFMFIVIGALLYITALLIADSL
jgi:hypothetical protein